MALTNKTPEQEVNKLFTRVAPKYDLMNNIVSLGLQKEWRKKFMQKLKLSKSDTCLDLCCGTGDLTISLAQHTDKVVGLDFNIKMLNLAQEKIDKANLQNKIKLIQADAMNLPIRDNSCDIVTIGFGLRNVPDADKTIKEAYRVLKPGGQFAILEMSQPTNQIIKTGWKVYFKIFPYLAKFTNSNVSDYQYLSKTTKAFLSAKALKAKLEKNKFKNIKVTKLTFGSGAIHLGTK